MRHAILLLILLTAFYASGQTVLFNALYPKPGGGKGSAVIERQDGNYLIAGTTENLAGPNSEINLLLVDSDGNLIWDKTIERADTHERSISLIETSNNNYLLSGEVELFGFPYLALFDSDGLQIWEHEYPQGPIGDGAHSVGEAITGNFFFLESSLAFSLQTNLLSTLYNVSATGEQNWTKEYDFANCRSVIRTADNGYALSGIAHDSTFFNFILDSDIILIKTNNLGDTMWTRRYEEDGYSNAYTLNETNDDGYIIAGFYENPAENMDYTRAKVIRTDDSGDTLWTKKYNSLGQPSYIAPTEISSGYIMSSSRYVQGPGIFGEDSLFMQITKLTTEGDIEWMREFDGRLFNFGNNVTETSDGGFLITGTSIYSSLSPGNTILIKLDSMGGFVLSTGFPAQNRSANITVYPNPATDRLTFKFNENDGGIKRLIVFSSSGKRIKELQSTFANEIDIQINDLANGIYFYEITSHDNERFSGKFMVNK